jgi:hypothetical protein
LYPNQYFPMRVSPQCGHGFLNGIARSCQET